MFAGRVSVTVLATGVRWASRGKDAGSVDSSVHAYPVSSVRCRPYGRWVPRPDFPRSVIEFQALFPDEEACRAYLFGLALAGWFCVSSLRRRRGRR